MKNPRSSGSTSGASTTMPFRCLLSIRNAMLPPDDRAFDPLLDALKVAGALRPTEPVPPCELIVDRRALGERRRPGFERSGAEVEKLLELPRHFAVHCRAQPARELVPQIGRGRERLERLEPSIR